jgi:sugar lactone lactonase YvrE
MAPELELLVDGVDFGEGPRWHDGRLWYSDFHQHAISAVSPDGHREVVHGDLVDRPSGLGWMPDGRLLVVSMADRKLLREHAGLP